MKSRSLLSKICIVSTFMCLPLFTLAQGGPGDPGDDPDRDGTPIPFDGGLSLLVGAGVAYGIKKANDKRKKNRAAESDRKESV